jgi:hypothetical protein
MIPSNLITIGGDRMKRILLMTFALVAFSQSSHASLFTCKTEEAQFFAKVHKLTIYEDGYTFRLKNITNYVESGTCPLDIYEAQNVMMVMPGKTKMKDGDEISGYLVKDIATGKFEIQ